MPYDSAQEVEGAAFVAAEAVPRPARPWVENWPPRAWWPRIELRELWDSREVAYFLALRNVKTRYKQTFFGAAWALIQPLSAVAIFSLVLGKLADVPSEGIPYPVFVFAGFTLWLYFASAVNAATDSLAGYRQLITKVYFPRLLAPLAAVMPALLDLAIAFGALVVFMGIFGVAPTAAIVLLPLWMLATVAFAFGVGVWVAALNVKYRDVRNAIPSLLQVWFFATPVAYGTSLLEGKWSFIVAANPMAGLIDGFRWSLVGTPAPGGPSFIALGVGALVLVTGIAYFARAERSFADMI